MPAELTQLDVSGCVRIELDAENKPSTIVLDVDALKQVAELFLVGASKEVIEVIVID